MKRFSSFLSFLFFSFAFARLNENVDSTYLGDTLQVTFGSYSYLPLSESDAISDGWTMINSGCDTYGKRYRLDGDYALTLMFDADGVIAGVQASVESIADSSWESFPELYEQVDNYYSISVFFRDPESICSSTSKVLKDTYGDRLQIRLSDGSYMDIPLNSDDLDVGSPNWILAKCFISMGTHYWKDISRDMECTDFYPVAIMYTRGTLRTFLFNILSTVGDEESSSRWEHPSKSSLGFFFYDDDEPQCIFESDDLTFSTMHLFVQNPVWNNCIEF